MKHTLTVVCGYPWWVSLVCNRLVQLKCSLRCKEISHTVKEIEE